MPVFVGRFQAKDIVDKADKKGWEAILKEVKDELDIDDKAALALVLKSGVDQVKTVLRATGSFSKETLAGIKEAMSKTEGKLRDANDAEITDTDGEFAR